MPTDLSIGLGENVSPEEFIGVAKNFFGCISEVARVQGDAAANIRWTVCVREGSTFIGVQPDSEAPPAELKKIHAALKRGLLSIRDGDVRGARLPEKVVDNLRKLSEFAGRHQNGAGMHFWIRHQSVPLGAEIAKNIRASKGGIYHDSGTIEGRLVGIQDHPLHIQVKDLLYSKPIRCFIPEELLADAMKNFRRRVEVEGKIRYRSNGTPISIEVKVMEVMRENHELPTIEEVCGIMANS